MFIQKKGYFPANHIRPFEIREMSGSFDLPNPPEVTVSETGWRMLNHVVENATMVEHTPRFR